MAEVRLPLHLSIEVDGLYHELEFTRAGIEPDGSLNSVSPAPVVTWESPVLAKYRFTFPLITPFVEAGPAFRTSGNLNGASPSNHGFVAGVVQKRTYGSFESLRSFVICAGLAIRP